MDEIVIATGNKHKLREIETYLTGTGIKFLSLIDFPEIKEIKETGSTFEENAVIKAQTLHDHTGLASLADDSGIIVDVLGNEPGVRSARYAGDDSNDDANNELLLSKIKALPEEKRTARFICNIALIDKECGIKIFKGECPGNVILELKGNKGFGYDPMFIPAGFDRTFGELEMEEKLKISHRARALEQLKKYLLVYKDRSAFSD